MADKTTVIGERTRVSGNLEGDEDLTVKGRIEGTLHLTKTLIVEGTGVVVANVHVKDCVISGVVVGDVSATDSVQLLEGCRMVGDVTAPRVIIVAGAAFRGRVDMGDLDSDRPARPRPVVRATPRSESAAPVMQVISGTGSGNGSTVARHHESSAESRNGSTAAVRQAAAPIRPAPPPRPMPQTAQVQSSLQRPATMAAVAPRIATAPNPVNKAPIPQIPPFPGGKKKIKKK